MSIEKGKITGFQATLLIIGFIFGSSVLLPPGRGAGPDAWFAVVLGMLEALLFALIYINLVRRFPGKTLVEILKEVYGRFLGSVVSLIFIWYVFHLLSLVLVNYLDFLKTSIIPQTPNTVVLLFITLICAYAARHGVEVIARCGEVLVPLTIVLIILITFVLLPNLKWENLQPMLQTPWEKLIREGHSSASFPFGETVVFTMILAYLNQKHLISGSVVKAITIGGFFLVSIVARTVAVLGQTKEIYTYPAFHAGRLIELGDVFTRMEMFVAVNFLTMGFIKISVLIYGTCLGLAQILELRSYRFLVLPISILAVLLALSNFSNVVENIFFAREVYPLYALLFQVVIPLATLGVALLRNLPKGGTK